MTDPIRLTDAGDPDLRELLRYTKAVGAPSTARVDALAARVLAELSAPAASPDDVGNPPRPLGATLSQWALGVAVLVALGTLAYRVLEHTPRPHSTRAAPAAAPALPPPAPSPGPPSARALAPEPPMATPQAGKPAAPRTQTRARMHKRNTIDGAANAAAKPGDPTAEIVILKRARHALASDPAAALALLAQHHREHPAGVFAEEREALAVEALWRAGDAERAAGRLRALLANYPRSTYRERLTALLEGAR